MKWIYWKRMRGMRFYRNSSLMVDFSPRHGEIPLKTSSGVRDLSHGWA